MTPRFFSPLVVRDDGGTFVVVEPLSYASAVAGLRAGGWLVWRRYRSVMRMDAAA